MKRYWRTGWILAMFLALMIGRAEGVTWTGREWDGCGRNGDIVQIGREPARADSIPYASAEQAVRGAVDYDKALSPWYLLLSQTEWKFSYCENPAEADSGADRDFWKADFDDAAWDDIFVPSVWQTQGYDHPIYTNTTQKFARNFGNEKIGYPRDLPKAPTVYNPVGLYRRTFEVPADWEGKRVYLDFEGVNAAFYLWINGVQVGYAEDSFTTDEFDITDFVNFGGENGIAVKVYRWCDGSWLEDQDYFDLSGIFRDVYCYAAEQVRVRDFSIVTDFDGRFEDSVMEVEVAVTNHLPEAQTAEVALHLYDAAGAEVPLDGAALELEIPAGEERVLAFAVPVAAPRKWSAEDPYLYTLVLEERSAAGTVYESAQVGFRKITYKTTVSGWFEGATDDQDLIRINGRPICFRGVNRHETHPEYGYALPREVMEEDIRIMLENNINAVRTSHYPNSPYWYYLCDKYGVYVVDEANLECHSNMIYENERLTEFMSAAIIDREYSMVRRDRNHACVVMWSLGNECKNPEILRTVLVREYADPEGVLRVLHRYAADRPWHYEQAGESYETGIDVRSGMYLKPEVLIAHGESNAAAPMIECEYEHAMGNSEGNFDEYWAAFDGYRNLQGGFIWDFVDQSIYAETPEGLRYFGYGGDFGERVHDENFCANGLLLPDRRVQPEMAEVRYHYQQVKFESPDAARGTVVVKNFFLFTDLAEKYELRWALLRDDAVLRQGCVAPEELRVPCVDAETNRCGEAEVAIGFAPAAEELRAGSEYFLNLSVRLREADGLLPAGHEIAWEQFRIEPGEEPEPEDVRPEGSVSWSREGDSVAVETEGLRVEFDARLGCMTRCQALDPQGAWRDLLVENSGPQCDFFRASTDNDRAFGMGLNVYIGMWRERGEYAVRRFDVDDSAAGRVRIAVEGAYPALNGMEMNVVYTVFAQGFVEVRASIAPNYNEDFVYLPVAGMSMGVPAAYEQLEWFGNGPEETYWDRRKGTRVGRWQTTVTENFFPYVQSSETGNHVGTRWLTLTDDSGFGLLVAAEESPVEFSALHYTARELDRAVHPHELNAIEDTVLRVNAVQMGVGGDDSWSRIVTHEQYLPCEANYEYGYILGAISPRQDAMELARNWRLAAN